MPAELSVKQPRDASPSFELRPAQRLAMVGLGYLPLAHVFLCGASVFFMYRGFGLVGAFIAGLVTVYIVPPLAVAVARPRSTWKDAPIAVGTPDFFRWWYTAQWQILFNRFPQLEEVLRLVPGLYSVWLRLWGARVGSLVYWSPSLRVFDRPFLEIGDRAVLGAGTTLSPHFLVRGSAGSTELVLAPIRIGADSLIGGASLLPAGVYVADREQTPGGRPIAPFSRFEQGERKRTRRFYKDMSDDA